MKQEPLTEMDAIVFDILADWEEDIKRRAAATE